MDWFKNLNARPRLMLSFGLLSCSSWSSAVSQSANLSQANDRLEVLYQTGHAGRSRNRRSNHCPTSLGATGRDAMLNVEQIPSSDLQKKRCK